MREIHLLDTGVFCRILRVPNMCSDEEHAQALAELSSLLEQPDTTLLLPVAVIYETGNHIAQNGDGNVRRQVARRFTEQVRQALNGAAPWRPTPLPELAGMGDWLRDFPNYAQAEIGLGDLSIIRAFEQQREFNPYARVRIWTIDQHLIGYDVRPGGPLAS